MGKIIQIVCSIWTLEAACKAVIHGWVNNCIKFWRISKDNTIKLNSNKAEERLSPASFLKDNQADCHQWESMTETPELFNSW